MSTPADHARSRTGEAYRVLRAAIVAGSLAPGSRLSPNELSQRFQLGPTPIREALARLAAENLAVAIEQRGYRAAPLSVGELTELLDLRLGFEREALIRSMRAGNDEWEAGIVAAYHFLARCEPPRPGQDAEAIALWGQRHDAFHLALIDGVKAPWLRRFHRQAIEQIERYRLAILRAGQAGPPDARLARILSHQDHAELRDAVLARDEPAALQRLDRHVGETAAIFAAQFAAVQARAKLGTG
ncbi:GntR family transcriptional regulator [Rhabdaerophilum sp.]|uniref:GntR family transcriptional regulator n=1 Tax=Rhabdaerophilum sp. TaxID=2717341 RepID=UPI0038D4F1A2